MYIGRLFRPAFGLPLFLGISKPASGCSSSGLSDPLTNRLVAKKQTNKLHQELEYRLVLSARHTEPVKVRMSDQVGVFVLGGGAGRAGGADGRSSQTALLPSNLQTLEYVKLVGLGQVAS